MFTFGNFRSSGRAVFKILKDRYSTSLTQETLEELPIAKRTRCTPLEHKDDHFGLFYTIPESEKKVLFGNGGFPHSVEANFNTFGETCLMVRKPALEIIDYLRNFDSSRPTIRFVLYGKTGTGKSLTLAHVIHYAYLDGFLILHIPWVWNWFRDRKIEVTNSQTRPGLVDLPFMSAQWLKNFQTQNSSLLSKLELPISKDYVWSQREMTPAGSPISELVSHGINRIKFAADCVQAIMMELKEAARQNKCKVFVAIDGFNGFFTGVSNLKTEDKTEVVPEKVTLAQSFFEITKQDWNNGAVVVTVDQMSGRHNTLHSHLPLYLLGKKGFEHLNPCVLIPVAEYNELELNSMMDYYEDRKWFVKKQGRHELSFLSNNNPYQLMKLCDSL